MASKKKVKKDEELIEVPVDKTSTDATFDVSNESVSVSCSGENSTVTEVVVEEKPKKGTSRRSAVAKNDDELLRLQELNARLQDQLSSKVADNERLADELFGSNEELKNLRKELYKMKQDNKRLVGENKANSALVEDMHNESVRTGNRVEELKSAIRSLQESNKSLGDKLSKRDKDFEEAMADNTEMRKAYSLLDARVSNLIGRKWWWRICFAFRYIFKGDKVFKD